MKRKFKTPHPAFPPSLKPWRTSWPTTATDLTRQRYDRGVVSYLELLDADRTRLQVELRHVQANAQQHIASVRLIKALG